MSLKETVAEKIRAITYAHRQRHLYDVWYLIGKNIAIDPNLVDSKLALYDEQFELEKLREGIIMMRENWKRDLRHLMPSVPPFDDVAEKVLAYCRALR